jgi:hypothetical protein
MITQKPAIDRLQRKRTRLTAARIAGKIDHLAHLQDTSLEIRVESPFDTAIDLFVYTPKYKLFGAIIPHARRRVGSGWRSARLLRNR